MGKGKLFTLGLLYGIGLTVLGVMLAGAGHGTSLLLDIASAPFSFGGYLLPLISPPLMWGALGWLLGGSSQRQRRIVVVLMLLHYLSLGLLPLIEIYPEEEYLAKMFDYDPGLVVLSAVYYLVGQILIWTLWFKAAQTTRHKELS